MTDKMLGEVEGGIGWLTINNLERHNAVSLEMAARGTELAMVGTAASCQPMPVLNR